MLGCVDWLVLSRVVLRNVLRSISYSVVRASKVAREIAVVVIYNLVLLVGLRRSLRVRAEFYFSLS